MALTSYRKGKKTKAKDYRITIPRAMQMPYGQVVKMKYVDTLAFSTAATGIVINVFRSNSIYDPDVTGVGHQPLAHDQWASFYGRYRVLRCSIKATFTQNQNTEPVLVGVASLENSATFTKGSTYSEQPDARCRLIGQDVGMNRGAVIYKVKTAVQDGDIGAFTDHDYTAAFGANPAEGNFFHVFAANANGNLTVDCNVLVEMWFTVRLYQRLDLIGS